MNGQKFNTIGSFFNLIIGVSIGGMFTLLLQKINIDYTVIFGFLFGVLGVGIYLFLKYYKILTKFENECKRMEL